MYGSDQMEYPEAIGIGIERIAKAGFINVTLGIVDANLSKKTLSLFSSFLPTSQSITIKNYWLPESYYITDGSRQTLFVLAKNIQLCPFHNFVRYRYDVINKLIR